MKSELEKMMSGEFYDFADPEIDALFARAKELMLQLNSMTRRNEQFPALMRQLIPDMAESAAISVPFYCDLGFRIKLGEYSFVNKNCTFLDQGGITIGKHTKIGPDCGFYTPQHPIDFMERRKTIERALPITIGDDCWIGGGVTICPGVTIGNRSIVAAGSVVVKDIPDDVLAAGNPAVVKRKLR